MNSEIEKPQLMIYIFHCHQSSNCKRTSQEAEVHLSWVKRSHLLVALVDFDPVCLSPFFKLCCAKNADINWVLNVRVCMLLKGTMGFNRPKGTKHRTKLLNVGFADVLEETESFGVQGFFTKDQGSRIKDKDRDSGLDSGSDFGQWTAVPWNQDGGPRTVDELSRT